MQGNGAHLAMRPKGDPHLSPRAWARNLENLPLTLYVPRRRNVSGSTEEAAEHSLKSPTIESRSCEWIPRARSISPARFSIDIV